MHQTSFWRAVLIVIIGVSLAIPAKAITLDDNARNIAIGIVAVAAAIVVVAVIVIRHESKERRDDYRMYQFSGNRNDYYRRQKPARLRPIW